MKKWISFLRILLLAVLVGGWAVRLAYAALPDTGSLTHPSVASYVVTNTNARGPKKTMVQFTLEYNSPSVWSQGASEGFISSNLALRKGFLDNKLFAILQIWDVFSTTKNEAIMQGGDFYSYFIHENKTPMVNLTLKYLINNYRDMKRRQGGIYFLERFPYPLRRSEEKEHY